MRPQKTKQIFGHATGKFNFLNPGNADRRYWPVGVTADQARLDAARTAATPQRFGSKRGATK